VNFFPSEPHVNESSSDETAFKKEERMPRPLQIWVMEDFSAHPGLIEDVLTEGFRAKGHSCPSLAIRILSWSRVWSALMTAMNSTERPDIIQIGSTWIRPLIHLGRLLPWSKDVEADIQWPLDPVARTLGESAWVEGYRYGVPWLVDFRLLYQRLSMLGQDVATSESFVDWTQQMSEHQRWLVPSAMEPSLVQLLAMWIWSSGCELIPNDGHFRKAWEPALHRLHELASRHVFANNSNDMGAAEASDRFFGDDGWASYLITRPWVLPAQGTLQATPIPVAIDGSPNIFVGGSYLAAIAQEDLHPAVFPAISILCTRDAQSVLAERTGYWPATAGVSLPTLSAKIPARVLDAIAKRGRGLPNVPHWRYLERLLERSGNALLNLAFTAQPWSDSVAVIERLEDEVAEIEAVTNL